MGRLGEFHRDGNELRTLFKKFAINIRICEHPFDNRQFRSWLRTYRGGRSLDETRSAVPVAKLRDGVKTLPIPGSLSELEFWGMRRAERGSIRKSHSRALGLCLGDWSLPGSASRRRLRRFSCVVGLAGGSQLRSHVEESRLRLQESVTGVHSSVRRVAGLHANTIR